MVQRRRILAGVGALAASGGCIGVLTGSKPLAFAATAATVRGSVAADAGYDLKGVETQTFSREFNAAGQSRRVEVDNRVATYEKSISFGPLGEAKLGVFALISTPAVELAGKTFNPVGKYDNDRLVRMLATNYDGLENVRKEGQRTAQVLGSTATVSKYLADATFSGTRVEVYVHVTKARHGSDFVVPVAVYPKLKSEEENVFRLLRNVEHETK